MPFEIPEEWCWCTVDDFAYVAAGSTPNKDAFVDEGIPYIKMYNLRNQKIDFDFHPQYIKEDVHNGKLQRSRTEVGDLIMNIVGPPLGKLAFIPESLPQSNFNQAAVLIRPYIDKNTINRWLFYYLSEMSEINSISTKGSAGQVNISLTQSQNMRVPMPPLAEQIRIVNKLDSLWNITEGIESGIKDVNCVINKFKSKILDLAIHGKLVPQDASDEPASELLKRINPRAVASCDNPHYAEPYDLPDGWIWCKLMDLCTFLSRGKSPKYSETDTTYPVFAQKCNLKEGGISLENARFLEPTSIDRWPDVYHLQTGDVLVNSTGTGTVGRTRLFNESCLGSYPFVVPDSHVSVVRTHSDIVSEYIFALMSSSWIQAYLEDNLAGSTNQKELYIGVLQNVDVPLPPIMEQKRIADKIESLYQQLDSIANHIE